MGKVKEDLWKGYQMRIPKTFEAKLHAISNETFCSKYGGLSKVIRNIVADWLEHYEADASFLNKSQWFEREARAYGVANAEV